MPPILLIAGVLILCIVLHRAWKLHRLRQSAYARVALHEAADREEFSFGTPSVDRGRFSIAASERLLETPTTAQSVASAMAAAMSGGSLLSSGQKPPSSGRQRWHREALDDAQATQALIRDQLDEERR